MVTITLTDFEATIYRASLLLTGLDARDAGQTAHADDLFALRDKIIEAQRD